MQLNGNKVGMGCLRRNLIIMIGSTEDASSVAQIAQIIVGTYALNSSRT